MSRDVPRDFVASIQGRLTSHAKKTGQEYQYVLSQHAIERFLFRLFSSGHARQFVLKGGQLFAVWTNKPHRTTRDVDLLAYGDNSEARTREIFSEICNQDVVPDGWRFDAGSISVSEITAAQDYPGKQVKLNAFLGRISVTIWIDIGCGDAVTPGSQEADYPTILEFPCPRINAYPKETVVAEKFQAMVYLGIANGRVKDFYDLWVLAEDFAFTGETLSQAIRATFARRHTELPKDIPTGLSAEFSEDSQKKKMWVAFAKDKGAADRAPSLAVAAEGIWRFLGPPVLDGKDGFALHWPPGGPWSH